MYQISNLGNVKSLSRKIQKSNGIIQTRKEYIMAKRISQDGYCIAKLSKNKKEKSIGVHRLVAMMFICNPQNLPEVNHIDCNRQNNSVDNLEWVTHKDNVLYSIKLGNHICTKNLSGKNNPNYNNHKLHYLYSNDRKLAKEKLSRLHEQNGMAKKIIMFDYNKDQKIEFNWIGGCINYLIDNKYTTSSKETIRRNISKSIKTKSNYLNCSFK